MSYLIPNPYPLIHTAMRSLARRSPESFDFAQDPEPVEGPVEVAKAAALCALRVACHVKRVACLTVALCALLLPLQPALGQGKEYLIGLNWSWHQYILITLR